MNDATVHDIALAILELEEAINSARVAADSTTRPKAVLAERLEVYHDIVEKQWSHLSRMYFHVRVGDLSEASQNAKVINGLSNMIRDDAHELIAERDGYLDTFRESITIC